MATTNFSQLSDAELDQLYKITQDSPSLIPNAAEREAVIAEWSRRKAGLKPQAPDNVENNLAASATPITPDPAVRPKAAKPAAMPAEASVADDEEAVAALDQQTRLEPGQSLEDFAAKHMEALRRRGIAWRRDAEAKSAAGYRDERQKNYDAETGLIGEDALPAMDGYNELTKEYTTPRAALHPMIARDRAIAQQQLEETAGAIGAKYGPANEGIYREGMADGVVDYRAVQSPAEAEANARWSQIEDDARLSPSVFVRAGARQQLRDREERTRNDPSHMEREIVRLSEATGVPPAEIRRRFAESRDQARTDMRDMANAQRVADRMARKRHWQAMTMLAGGSQNINAANRPLYSQLAMMPQDALMQQLQYGLPGGEQRAAVDARQLDVAARLAGNAIAGQLGGFAQAANPVVQNQVAQQQLAQQQEAIKWAEDNINANYAWDADSLFESDFTEAERTQAINDLMVRYGPPNGRMTLAEATRIVDNIGARKRRPRQAAPSGGPGDDAGAMPAVSA